ncbi:hypothetical protein IX336_001863 [Porphyromonas levii]|uniref:hypothetical protein n=1 Tax=Porphyromonas levii TaxID=28114 RepID=UPI001BA7439D|nr:hypothetical protein [Porphyromonas levii]MBR8766472.1 hypothetical protein [Porphyromonas levii]
MVGGFEIFREFFQDYEDNYVIIGGTACEVHEYVNAQVPRATKDIDIILVVEALSREFVTRFWEFIKSGDYEKREVGGNVIGGRKHEYFRFLKPKQADFPYQLELFSRNLGLINFPEDAHITPVPISDDLSSLSAILMDDDYYGYTIENSEQIEGVQVANKESLICLKAKAFLDLSERRAKGYTVDKKNVDKHKKDVFRLVAMLAPSERFTLPNTLKEDLTTFCEIVRNELPNQDFFKSIKLHNVSGEQLVELLEMVFMLHD